MTPAKHAAARASSPFCLPAYFWTHPYSSLTIFLCINQGSTPRAAQGVKQAYPPPSLLARFLRTHQPRPWDRRPGSKGQLAELPPTQQGPCDLLAFSGIWKTPSAWWDIARQHTRPNSDQGNRLLVPSEDMPP